MGDSKVVSGTGFRRAVSFGAAAAVIAGSALAVSPAMADKGDYKGDPDFTGATTNVETDQNGDDENATMFGAYIPSAGYMKDLRVWCIDAGLDWPYGDGFKEADAKDAKAAQLSYLMAKFDKERGSQADQMSYDMALSEHIHGSDELKHRDILDTRSIDEVTKGLGWDEDSKNVKAVGAAKFKDTVLPDAVKYSKQMTDEAKKYAGDGTFSVKVDVAKDKGKDSGTATVSLVNSKGTVVPGFDGTLTVDGAKAEKTAIKSGTEATVVKLSDFDGSTAKVSATFKSLPTGSVTVHTPKDYKTSDFDRYNLQQVVQKQTTKASASDSVNIDVPKSSPKVTTTISAKEVKPGDKVHDNFTVSGLEEGQKVDVSHTLYASKTKPEQGKEVPKDAEKLGTVVSKDVTNGDHKSPTVTIPDDFSGWVTWTEEIKADEDNAGWESDYGIPDETGFAKAQPTIKTTASDDITALPAKAHDTGVIEDCFPGSEITIKTEAYFEADGTIEQSKTAPKDAKKLGEIEQKVTCEDDGTAKYETKPMNLPDDLVKPGEKGAISFKVSGSENEYNTSFTDDYGVPSEVVNVEVPKGEKPAEPTTPAPAPDEPKKEVKTGAYADGSGPNTGLIIGGGAAALLAIAGAATYFIRRQGQK